VLGEMALKAENPSQNSRTQFMLLPVLTGVSPVLALHNEHRRQGRSTRRCHHILTIIGNDLKNMNFYLHTFRLRDATAAEFAAICGQATGQDHSFLGSMRYRNAVEM